MKDNGADTPKAPQNIRIQANMDLATQTAVFTEVEVNGLVMITPKQITVPLQTILVMAAQATLAMMGIHPGQAAEVKGPNPGSGASGPRLI